jgi:hypothetical protein
MGGTERPRSLASNRAVGTQCDPEIVSAFVETVVSVTAQTWRSSSFRLARWRFRRAPVIAFLTAFESQVFRTTRFWAFMGVVVAVVGIVVTLAIALWLTHDSGVTIVLPPSATPTT